MKYQRFGKTGMQVSHLGLGAIKFGSLSQEEATKLIQIAHEGGINYIDTARGYGDSEIRVGTALKELGLREQFILSSKVIRRGLTEFQEDIETTFRNLQTEYLDILFLHDVSTAPNWNRLQKEGVLTYIQELRASGRVRHLGISTHDCKIGEEIIRTGLFEVAMLAYNPTNREVEDTLFPLCQSLDMGVIIMKPYGGGVLTHDRSRQLGFEMEAEDCLRFALSNPYVTTVIPGMEQEPYLKTALAVEAEDPHLTQEEIDAILGKIDMKVKNYCRGCGYCLPCPQQIPIPTVLSLYNRWEIFGGVDWSHMHHITEEYTQKVPADRTAKACVGCGSCAQRCPFNLPIPDLMKKAAKELRRYD